MGKKQTILFSGKPATPILPRSRREELLDALSSGTSNPVQLRILKAFRAGGSVAAAEMEFKQIIQEIVNEA